MSDEETVDQLINVALACLRMGVLLGDSRCAHAVKVLTSADLSSDRRRIADKLASELN